MFDLGLSGAHTLITGASGGIGLATAKAFVDQDALVTAHFNTQEQPLVDAFGPDNERVCRAQANVESEEEVERMFTAARAKLGKGVEVLVVNHAYIGLTDYAIRDMPLSEWTKTLSINLTGSFILAKCFLNQLQYVAEEDRHRIAVVFIGSTAGLFGEAFHADYASSKAGLDGLQKSLKNEIVLIAPRARVNVVNPGWTRTPAVAKKLADPDVVYAALATTPLKKLAEPEDVANHVLSLASWRLSGHVTGQSIYVAGGMEGRLLNKVGSI